MGDWDDEEVDDFVATKLTTNWDDDLVDTVPDAWDAEETKEVKPKPAAPEKLSLAERIKLKEEKRRKEKEEKLKREEELRSEQSMSELQREKLAEESELGLLQDTFGKAPVENDSKVNVDVLTAKTKAEFDKLNELLKEKMTKLETSPHYNSFSEQLIRDLMVGMDVESLKSVSTAISALVAEKQKLVKGKVKKGKAKGKLMVERENDYNFQEDAVEPDEYDDFI